jgi:hypothetical protein
VACVYYPLTTGISVTRLLQGIASGLLGTAAFSGGTVTAILGLKCHYTIVLLWTLLFFALYPRVPILSRSRALTGAAASRPIQLGLGLEASFERLIDLHHAGLERAGD